MRESLIGKVLLQPATVLWCVWYHDGPESAVQAPGSGTSLQPQAWCFFLLVS